MAATRDAARRVLQFVIRRAPAGSRAWGDAMMREMDFVDSDWDALLWALGSTVALCRHSLIEQLRNRRWSLQRNARVIASVLSGVAAAATVLIISMLTLQSIQRTSWYAPSQGRLVELLFAVVIPDALCLLGAVILWRTHRRLASGILAAGAALGAHSIIFFVA